MEEKPRYTCKELMKKVLKEYHSEIDVFLKQDTDILPDHRDENHKIELLEGKQASFVRKYKPLSEQKIDAIKKYIDEHLGKGFIRPSSSAAAAFVLLVRKPGDGLRFYVNYKALNAIMVKNKYSIPLINEMLSKLSNAR